MNLERQAEKLSAETGMHYLAAYRHLKDRETLRNRRRPYVPAGYRQYDPSMIEVIS